MKQETIEEAANMLFDNVFGQTMNIQWAKEKAIELAQWQQENMIEELEMHVLINEHDWNRNPQAQFKDFVEQFKNK